MEDTPSKQPTATSIRFEDLGEPIQKLIKSLNSDVSSEEMELLTYVSVKDMAKIYSELYRFENSNKSQGDNAPNEYAEALWAELKVLLQERREQFIRRDEELQQKEAQLLYAEKKEKERQQKEDEQDAKQQEEEEKEEIAAEAKDGEGVSTENEVQEKSAEEREQEKKRRQAELEEKRQKRLQKEERKRKKREARAKEVEEERQLLLAEKEQLLKQQNEQKLKNQQKEWESYVQNHPLEFASTGEIEQQKVQHLLNTPMSVVAPKAGGSSPGTGEGAKDETQAILNRTYTPKCPKCFAKFASPPALWNCPFCQKRDDKEVKVWQPDDDNGGKCMICQKGVGRFTRHHCRCCGRLVCGACNSNSAVLQGMGFGGNVKVCDDCANMPSARQLLSV